MGILIRFVACVCILLAGRSASAQRVPPPAFPTFYPQIGYEREAGQSYTILGKAPTHESRDYRWEGLLAGSVMGAALGGYVFNAWCRDPDNASRGSCVTRTVEGAVIGAVIVGTVGGLVGTLIPKSSSVP